MLATQTDMDSLTHVMYKNSFKQIEKLFGNDSSTRKWFSSQVHRLIHSMLQNVLERAQTYSEELDSMLRMSGSGESDPHVLQSCLNSARLTEEQLNQTFYRKMAECRRTTGSSLSSAASTDLSHIRALRKCHQLLINDLCVVDTGLKERLVSDGLLTPSDSVCIQRQSSASSQNEKFLEFLSRGMDKRAFHEVFLPELRRDAGNKHLADQLEQVLAQVKGEPQDVLCIFCALTDEVDPKVLARPLFTKDAISSNTHKDLRDGPMSREKKWYLLRRDLRDNQKLLEVLKETEPNMYKLIQKRPLPLDYCCCNQLENERFREAGANEKGRASACSLFSDSFPGTFQKACPTDGSGRRICVIFDNLSYRRPCYKHDVLTLQCTFEQFDFDVRVSSEVNHEKMYSVLEDFAKREGGRETTQQKEHKIIDCLVVILLVHLGDRDHILDIDNKSCRLDRLTSLLTASACPGLAGKPKIFILPASLGCKDMSGSPEFQSSSSEEYLRVQGARVWSMTSSAASRGTVKGGPVQSETSQTETIIINVIPASPSASEMNLTRISERSENDPKCRMSESVVEDSYCSSGHDPQAPASAAVTCSSRDTSTGASSLPASSSADTARSAAPAHRNANGSHLLDEGGVELRRRPAQEVGLPQAATENALQAPALPRVPDEADFLLAFATCPGYVMWTDPTDGSRYVNVLTHVLQKHSHARDLVACLTLVGEEVAKMEMSPNSEMSFKQMPCFISTLRKPVYLREVRNSVWSCVS